MRVIFPGNSYSQGELSRSRAPSSIEAIAIILEYAKLDNMNINHQDMKKNAAKAAKLLKTLAHPARLMILCQLVRGKQNVSELCLKSSLSQSAFSQHLAVLRREKLVVTYKEAQTVYYSLADDKAVRVLELMYTLYCS